MSRSDLIRAAACVNEAVKIVTNMSYNMAGFMQYSGQEVRSTFLFIIFSP